MIKFLCPNGHPLSTPESLSGREGQCPRCQTQFVVPKGEDAHLDAAHAVDHEPRTAAPDADLSRLQKFVFLCPNGHKLHGSADLQGRPGQCPHCGSRFLIPTESEIEDLPDYEEHQVNIDPDYSSYAEGDTPVVPGMATAEPVVIEFRDDPPLPPAPVSCHPLGQIIRRLWSETRGAGALELKLDSEETIVAESFSAELSQHEFGVFAVRGDNKTQAVTIVPWESITQASLRNLADLPTQIFRAPPVTRPRSGPPR